MSEQQIELPTVPNHRYASLIRLWNYLTGKLPDKISKILLRMNPTRLFRFLEFMSQICLHDQTVEYSQRRLEYYQTVLMCCPRLILTQYLLSTDEQCVVNLLERCDVVWTMYFIGLIELGLDLNVNVELSYLMEVYDDLNFVFSLGLFLMREASNRDLPHQLRQNIFGCICENPDMVLLIVDRENEHQSPTVEESIRQMNQWSQTFSRQNGFELVPQWSIDDFRMNQEPPQHRDVDAEAFVCQRFPSLHPPEAEREYFCGMCRCGPDEPNDDRTHPVFRSMPCCPQQMACHGCLVKWATLCNTPDHQNEFKNTSIFVCSFCRAETEFFPDENERQPFDV